MTDAKRKRFEQLMMQSLDDEISGQDRRDMDIMMKEHDALRREYESFKQLKEVTQNMDFKKQPLETWDLYWTRVYNRLERNIAWTLISIGAAICLTFAGFEIIEQIIRDPHLHLIVKIGFLCVLAGGALLLVSTVRERIKTGRNDPYKEVIR